MCSSCTTSRSGSKSWGEFTFIGYRLTDLDKAVEAGLDLRPYGEPELMGSQDGRNYFTIWVPSEALVSIKFGWKLQEGEVPPGKDSPPVIKFTTIEAAQRSGDDIVRQALALFASKGSS